MFHDLYIAISAFLDQGGDVLYLIGALAFVMWTLIIERAWYFQIEHKGVIADATEVWESRPERTSWSAHMIREGLVSESAERITGALPFILACVALAPLLGLLGTVTGMISVFDAMATQGGNARSMAAGVSMATIPTMAGMVTALSGVLGSTFLKSKINFEIELLQDHLTMDH